MLKFPKKLVYPLPRKGDGGAFGDVRKHHIHEGIDLYCPEGTPVYAIESGTVVAKMPFTGVLAGSPWWEETQCLMIEGESGVINYGEIRASSQRYIGSKVMRGAYLGEVKRVLKKDKGRPMAMLHVELYKHGTRVPIKEWSLGQPQPENLLDPTPLFKESVWLKFKGLFKRY